MLFESPSRALIAEAALRCSRRRPDQTLQRAFKLHVHTRSLPAATSPTLPLIEPIFIVRWERSVMGNSTRSPAQDFYQEIPASKTRSDRLVQFLVDGSLARYGLGWRAFAQRPTRILLSLVEILGRQRRSLRAL